jgi:rfaE bifunctional protein kinase chain/domain
MRAFLPPDFSHLRVAVAGDLICDHYVSCEPRGLSREAPVMVLRHVGERCAAGGAANVARNVRALGAATSCLGAVGRDERGREVLELLERDGIDVSGVQSLASWTTPTKTRVIAAEVRRWPQQVLRIDRDPAHPLEESVGRALRDTVRARAGRLDALVVSDYGYGAVGDELATAARDLAAAGATVVLDPRRRVAGFEGVTALTPNVGELAGLVGVDSSSLSEPRALARAALTLLDSTGARFALITRGNEGMALWGEGLPAEGVLVAASGSGNVTDVTGAGDTSAAVFALALAAGSEPVFAMQLANAAAGVVVMEGGTATCSAAALRAALPAAPPALRASAGPAGAST